MNPFVWLWRRLGLDVVVRRAPMVGEVKNAIFIHGADFSHPKFGESRAFPAVLEIVVDDEDREPGGVGKLVKRALFPQDGRFFFNVAFSCGDPGLFGKGLYTDPRSIWFNVFFGYYQIDTPHASWSRPFGYRLGGGGHGVEFADIVRIGKADWNYFSNHLYGVPLSAIRPLDAVDLGAIRCEYLGRERIGQTWWDHVVLDGVEVVSAYTAPGEQDRLHETDRLFSPIWRAIFGRPCPRPEWPRSFVTTRMRAELYMAWAEGTDVDVDGPVRRTLIFGGTVRSDHPNPDEAREFLGVQLSAVKKVMAHAYARDGFTSAAPS